MARLRPGLRPTGSIAGLSGGASDNSSMTVGISDTTAGHKTGTVPVNFTSKAVGGSGLSDTALTPQMLTLTGDVYNYAAANAIASPGNVGKVFKNVAVQRTLTVANLAAGPYAEGLDASFGTPGGDVTAAGSVTNLMGSDSTSMALTLDTSTAGPKNGSVEIHLKSNGTNSGLSDTVLPLQSASMSGSVYDHGVASFDGEAQVDVFNLVLSGSVGQTITQSYGIYNLLQTAGYTGKIDLLSSPARGTPDGLTAVFRRSPTWRPADTRPLRQAWTPVRPDHSLPSIPWT